MDFKAVILNYFILVDFRNFGRGFKPNFSKILKQSVLMSFDGLHALEEDFVAVLRIFLLILRIKNGQKSGIF